MASVPRANFRWRPIIVRRDTGALKISLVVPVRNEAQTLAALLESIERQTRPPDEIVVVDGGSVDGTAELARSLTWGFEHVRVIEAGDATPGRARNVGIDAASFDLIALTDAGIRLAPDWLDQLVARAEADPSLDVVFGTVELAPRGRLEAWAGMLLAPPMKPVPGGRARGPSVASMLLRRSSWRDANGFPDLRASEDLIFLARLASVGAKTAWAPGARVSWNLPNSLRETFEKMRVYSYSGVMGGLASDWQHGVSRYYALAAPFVLAGAFVSRKWLTVPVAGLLARTARECWRRRNDGDHDGAGVDAETILAVAALTVVVDTAMFIGWAEALRERRRARGRPASRSESCVR
jgi:glycosyltransferase involved in cell wall biosynthesis